MNPSLLSALIIFLIVYVTLGLLLASYGWRKMNRMHQEDATRLRQIVWKASLAEIDLLDLALLAIEKVGIERRMEAHREVRGSLLQSFSFVSLATLCAPVMLVHSVIQAYRQKNSAEESV